MANLEYESKYYDKGLTLIAGSDEAGRGPLAGPLVVAACILPKGYQHELINDSKKLTDKKRRMLYETIKKDALAYHIEVIDILGVDNAYKFYDLNEELKKAMGCTEPIAISYLSATARDILGDIPSKIDVFVSGNALFSSSDRKAAVENFKSIAEENFCKNC